MIKSLSVSMSKTDINFSTVKPLFYDTEIG